VSDVGPTAASDSLLDKVEFFRNKDTLFDTDDSDRLKVPAVELKVVRRERGAV
jgi:hypothetical protein